MRFCESLKSHHFIEILVIHRFNYSYVKIEGVQMSWGGDLNNEQY